MTTSPASRTTKTPCSPGEARGLTLRPARGFSLVELLLAVALLAVLLTVTVAGLGGMAGRRQLSTGLEHLAATLRYAAADAAATGTIVELQVEPGTGDLVVYHQPRVAVDEANGDTAGTLVPYDGCPWASHLPNDLVRVARCERVGVSAHRTLTYGGAMEDRAATDAPLDAVRFYPDGSSDFVELDVVSRDASDPRVGVVSLNGMTGRVQTSTRSPNEPPSAKE